VLRGIAAGGAAVALPSAAEAAATAEETDPTTRATFRAVVDAVVPSTPELAEELGPEHEPGGLEIGLEDYLLSVTNTIFSAYDAPDLVVAAIVDEEVDLAGEVSVDIYQEVRTEQDQKFNLRLAEFVARICDVTAVELLARGGNGAQPDPGRFEASNRPGSGWAPFPPRASSSTAVTSQILATNSASRRLNFWSCSVRTSW